MSFSAVSHCTLVFVALLIHNGVDGAKIPTSIHRRADPDSSGNQDPDHDNSSTTNYLQTTSASAPSSTGSTNSQVSQDNGRHTGTIVGAVLGSLIVAGLLLMFFAKRLRQARKERKQPRSGVPSTYFIGQQPPHTEISQTQNAPLLASSAPHASPPVPTQFFNASPPSASDHTRSSTLSHFPVITLHDPQDTASPPNRQLSSDDSHGTSTHVPSDIQSSLSPTILSPQNNVASASSASPSTSTPFSSLHHDMAEFQKALEVDHKRDHTSDVYQPNIIHDPPPSYVD